MFSLSCFFLSHKVRLRHQCCLPLLAFGVKERWGWNFVSPSLGLNLSYVGNGWDKRNWSGWNDLLFEIFVCYHNFNEISVLPAKMWGKSTDFILILGLYIVLRFISLGFLIQVLRKKPLLWGKWDVFMELPEFLGFIILWIIHHDKSQFVIQIVNSKPFNS